MFAQCIQWQYSSQQAFTRKPGGFISAIIIKENKSEKRYILAQKSELIKHYGSRALLKKQLMYAQEFVLIPTKMFTSKNATNKEVFGNSLYQQ